MTVQLFVPWLPPLETVSVLLLLFLDMGCGSGSAAHPSKFSILGLSEALILFFDHRLISIILGPSSHRLRATQIFAFS